MRIYKAVLIGIIALAQFVHSEDGPVDIGQIMEQLPADMEENLIDPVTVEKHPTFANGESLKFKLGWGIFSVAKASLQTVPDKYQDTACAVHWAC